MRRNPQIRLPGVFEHSLAQRERAILRYATANRERYLGFAHLIEPDRSSFNAVYDRVAFAILSANAPFDSAVRALSYVAENRGNVEASQLTRYPNQYPRKALFLNTLATHGLDLVRKPTDTSWHVYRLRLAKDVDGLGLCKASFAASLLYPTTSDLACIDTHVCRFYLGEPFRDLNVVAYVEIEARIRGLARKVGVNTFIMQWLLWDHVRGSITDHAVFPGSHK